MTGSSLDLIEDEEDISLPCAFICDVNSCFLLNGESNGRTACGGRSKSIRH